MPLRNSCLLALGLVILGGGCGGSAEGVKPGAAAPTSKPLVFVGFDANAPLVNALKEGKLQGLVVQNPYRMGELGVEDAGRLTSKRRRSSRGSRRERRL